MLYARSAVRVSTTTTVTQTGSLMFAPFVALRTPFIVPCSSWFDLV
jgi:hypothetical protein